LEGFYFLTLLFFLHRSSYHNFFSSKISFEIYFYLEQKFLRSEKKNFFIFSLSLEKKDFFQQKSQGLTGKKTSKKFLQKNFFPIVIFPDSICGDIFWPFSQRFSLDFHSVLILTL